MSYSFSQKQHVISQVYLKQFGYKRDGNWYISVLDRSKKDSEEKEIASFLTETNIFDLPYSDPKHIRHFENNSSIIEREYKTVINTIKNQKQIIPRHKDVLCYYVSNLVCRSKSNRIFFKNLIDHDRALENLITEITAFNPESIKDLKDNLRVLPKKYHLNYVIGFMMNFFVNVFRNFTSVILQDYGNLGWLTSDNPILIDIQNDSNKETNLYPYLIPIEAEIYFPLSPDYCLFLFHQNSRKKNNILRDLQPNKISGVSEDVHNKICNMIAHNTDQYFIFNQEMKTIYL